METKLKENECLTDVHQAAGNTTVNENNEKTKCLVNAVIA